MENEVYEFHKKFWDGFKDSILPHSTDEWIRKYSNEILGIIGDAKNIIDAGCGAGEITCELAKHVDKILAIDYSESMLEEAKKKAVEKQLKNIDFIHSDILNLSDHFSDQMDAIYCNGVIQYLSFQQIDLFVEKSKQLLKKNGIIALMNIPNVALRDFYRIGAFHQTKYIPFSKYIKGYIHLKLRDLVTRLKVKEYVSDGIGFWYAMEDFNKIAKKYDLHIDCVHSRYPPFGYRFHVFLKK